MTISAKGTTIIYCKAEFIVMRKWFDVVSIESYMYSMSISCPTPHARIIITLKNCFRRRTCSHKRRARSGGVSHPFERLTSCLKSLPPPAFHNRPSRLSPQGPPCGATLPPPARPVQAALRLAPGHSHGGSRAALGGAPAGAAPKGRLFFRHLSEQAKSS